MGLLDGKVALVTGAARGQGRSHAVRLAEEGADIVAIDVCAPIETVNYKPATNDDLDETAALVEKLGRRVVARQTDVRDLGALQTVVADGVAELGGLDVVVANAGIWTTAPVHEMTEEQWSTMIDINLTGVWKTVRATVPTLIEQGRGGSIILISSVGGNRGFPNFAHYVAAKHAIVGLTRTMANELGQYYIRANAVLPATVLTEMVDHADMFKVFRPDLENPTREDFAEVAQNVVHVMPIPWIDTRDISEAVVWLASDQSRYVTGIELPVDAGACQRV